MAATSWSGFWGDGAGSVSSYALLYNKNPIRGRIRQTVNRDSMRTITALFNGLIGATTGGTVTATHARIKGNNVTDSTGFGNGSQAGARQIETVSDINRATVAADVTALKELVYNVTHRPSTYPADLSKNGGAAY